MISMLSIASADAAAAPAAPANAVTPAAPTKTRVLVLDLKASGGVQPDVVENITGLTAAILSEDERLEVLAGPDLRQMMALEGQKVALGCADDTSCVAEVAGALGAKLVVFGNVGYLGSLLNFNVTLYDQEQGRNVGRRSAQAKGLEEVPTALRPALAALMAAAIGAPTTTTTTTAPSAASNSGSIVPWVVTGTGAAVLVGGAIMLAVGVAPFMQVSDEEAKFRNGDAAALDRAADIQAQWYDDGLAPLLTTIGAIGVGVGSVATGAGIAWAMTAGGE